MKEETWTVREEKTVSEADSLFGNSEWRHHILNNKSIKHRQETLLKLYKNRLHKWFRYVLPLPFNPKGNQIFHLILCSNYETGVRMTKNEYSKITGNPKYAPDRNEALENFRRLHLETFKDLEGGRRVPLQWRIFWSILKQHEGGICDCMCVGLRKIEQDILKIQNALDWLADKGYLEEVDYENPWDASIRQYKLRRKAVREKLGVSPPYQLNPISPEQIRELEDAKN